MGEMALALEPVVIDQRPDISHIITEDDEPVDNLFSAKQQRLLVEPLYTSWQPDRLFVADANVGVFGTPHDPPVVPDMFLSLDVKIAENWYAKEHRTYFIWEFGKAPDVVIEIVSNKKGGELSRKMRTYAHLRIWYYVVYDPQLLLQDGPLQIYELRQRGYVPVPDNSLQGMGLQLTLWQGLYETRDGEWLRWCDAQGNLLPTGAERAAQEQRRAVQERRRANLERQRADQEQQRADQEQQRADQEQQRADQEQQRAERLVAQLRALGIEPEA